MSHAAPVPAGAEPPACPGFDPHPRTPRITLPPLSPQPPAKDAIPEPGGGDPGVAWDGQWVGSVAARVRVHRYAAVEGQAASIARA